MKAWILTFAFVGLACSRYNVQKPVAQPGGAQADNSAASQDATTQGADTATKDEEKPAASTNTNDTPTMTPTNTAPTTPVPATGSVTVNLNLIPPTPAGTYRNRGHVRAIWVTDANDKYMKTIQAFANARASNMRRWQTFTGNTLDATTGATQTTPAAGLPLTATWDLKDKAGTQQMTGNYKLWLEFVEANTPALDNGKKPADPAQAIDNVNGYRYMIVPFTVAPAGTTKTDSSNAVFKDVAVKHVP